LPAWWQIPKEAAGYFLRGFLARSFPAARRGLLTTLLPDPIAPTGAAFSSAAWM
jgi:hypothetical protein